MTFVLDEENEVAEFLRTYRSKQSILKLYEKKEKIKFDVIISLIYPLHASI